MEKLKEKNLPHFDLNELKKEAMKHLEKGAVTEDYPLKIKDAWTILNSALATEILCVLRYRHHEVIAKGMDKPQVAAEFREHAQDEEKHMLMIADRINQLGGNPDFNPLTIKDRTVTEYGPISDNVTLKEMIKADLIAERIVISVYKKLIAWFGKEDPTSRRMLENILKDEEDHAEDLADLLSINQ